MISSQEVEGLVHRAEKDLAVVDVNVEFTLKSIMHVHAGRDIWSAVWVLPGGFEGEGNAIPPLWV